VADPEFVQNRPEPLEDSIPIGNGRGIANRNHSVSSLQFRYDRKHAFRIAAATRQYNHGLISNPGDNQVPVVARNLAMLTGCAALKCWNCSVMDRPAGSLDRFPPMSRIRKKQLTTNAFQLGAATQS
jgi:hypothetical protein